MYPVRGRGRGRGRGRFQNHRNDNINRQPFQRNHNPQYPYRHKKEYKHQDQLTEVEVGITEYVNKLEGFTGIIKARYSDFHVNEINPDGVVAKLTDTSSPKDFVAKVERIDYKEVAVSPLKQIPQDTWDAIKNLVTSEQSEPVNLDAETLSKEDRKMVHECVKTHFGQKVVASTLTIDDKKFVQFKKFNKGDKTDKRFQWPDDKGEYVYFLVYKEALDTMDACLKISDCLNTSPANLSYAGVKDKRAKTTQWFCVRKVQPWKLMKKTRPLRNITVGNYTFHDVPLKLGHLQGNKFRIALRNVNGENDLINKSLESIKEHGFVNYYGLQRFGNDKEVPTYDVGIKLLRGKWKEAAQLILKSKASDDPYEDISKAKKVYSETGDAVKAFMLLKDRKNKCIEARLLEALKKANENDYVNALENIPRNMRLFYIHAFQSLIWNKMVSKRLQLFGMQPVEGDFVLVDKSEEQGTVENESELENQDQEKQMEGKTVSVGESQKKNEEIAEEEVKIREESQEENEDEDQKKSEEEMADNSKIIEEESQKSSQGKEDDMSEDDTEEIGVLENVPQPVWETKFYENHSRLNRNFVNSLERYSPMPQRKYKKRTEWITREIMEAIDRKDKLHKKYNKDKNDEETAREFKQVRNKVTEMVRNAKRRHQLKMERFEKEEDERLKCKQGVKALTADDLANYTIYDIVLPLPGYDIRYPENMKEYYKEALEEYGLTLEMTKQRVKTYTLCGDYRKLVERAKNMSWKMMFYNDPTYNLIRSDLEELRREQEPKSITGGSYKALVMEFDLPSSSYATMVLREILKTDTASSAHARLNDYHQSNANKKIIITDHAEDSAAKADTCEASQSSLLSDPAKYEEFKSSIFKAVECPAKRKNENEEEDEGSKRAKKEENVEQSGIKMEASLV